MLLANYQRKEQKLKVEKLEILAFYDGITIGLLSLKNFDQKFLLKRIAEDWHENQGIQDESYSLYQAIEISNDNIKLIQNQDYSEYISIISDLFQKSLRSYCLIELGNLNKTIKKIWVNSNYDSWVIDSKI